MAGGQASSVGVRKGRSAGLFVFVRASYRVPSYAVSAVCLSGFPSVDSALSVLVVANRNGAVDNKLGESLQSVRLFSIPGQYKEPT